MADSKRIVDALGFHRGPERDPEERFIVMVELVVLGAAISVIMMVMAGRFTGTKRLNALQGQEHR